MALYLRSCVAESKVDEELSELHRSCNAVIPFCTKIIQLKRTPNANIKSDTNNLINVVDMGLCVQKIFDNLRFRTIFSRSADCVHKCSLSHLRNTKFVSGNSVSSDDQAAMFRREPTSSSRSSCGFVSSNAWSKRGFVDCTTYIKAVMFP